MRLNRAFRPRIADLLEDRVVPSSAPVQAPPVILGRSVAMPSQVQLDSTQVQSAFEAFLSRYGQAVNTVLLAPGPNGLLDPAANRAAFDAAVRQALDTLASNLVRSLGNVSLDSSEVSQVVAAIVGDGPGSLESQLIAMSTSSIAQTATDGTVNASILPTISQAVAHATGQAVSTTLSPIPQSSVTATATTDDLAVDSPSASSSSAVVSEVRAAFGGFLNEYYQAVNNVLLAAGSDGTVNPAASRAAFDAQVDSVLQTLNSTLESDLGNGSGSSAPSQTIGAAILGDAPGSLQSQLAALPSPTGTEAAVVRSLTLSSFRIVVQAFAVIAGDIAEFFTAASSAN